MSAFDPDLFAQTAITGANDTRFAPVPEADAALVQAKSYKIRSTDKGYVILDLTWSVQEQAARDATGLEDPTVRQSIFLDTDGSALALGKGKNVGLGKLREALGLNDPTKPFRFDDIVGRMARAKISHRITPDGDTFAEVKGVIKA